MMNTCNGAKAESHQHLNMYNYTHDCALEFLHLSTLEEQNLVIQRREQRLLDL